MQLPDDQVIFDTPYCQFIQRPHPVDQAPYYLVDADDYVCIMGLSPSHHVLLVRQYRPAAAKAVWEWPAGHVDPGETPVQAARRELKEETGIEIEVLHELGCLYPDTGRLANRAWYFFTDQLPEPDQHRRASVEEGIEIQYFSFDDYLLMIKNNQFPHALHLTAHALAQCQGLLPAR